MDKRIQNELDIITESVLCTKGMLIYGAYNFDVPEEPFDYTEWRKEQPWYDMTFEEMRETTRIHCPQKSFGLDNENN